MLMQSDLVTRSRASSRFEMGWVVAEMEAMERVSAMRVLVNIVQSNSSLTRWCGVG